MNPTKLQRQRSKIPVLVTSNIKKHTSVDPNESNKPPIHSKLESKLETHEEYRLVSKINKNLPKNHKIQCESFKIMKVRETTKNAKKDKPPLMNSVQKMGHIKNQLENSKHVSESDIEFEASDKFRKMILNEQFITPQMNRRCSAMKFAQVDKVSSSYNQRLNERKNPHLAALQAIENLESSRKMTERKLKDEFVQDTPIKCLESLNHRYPEVKNPYEQALKSIEALRLKRILKSAKKVKFMLDDCPSSMAEVGLSLEQNKDFLTEVNEQIGSVHSSSTPELEEIIPNTSDEKNFSSPNLRLSSYFNDKRNMPSTKGDDSTPELDLHVSHEDSYRLAPKIKFPHCAD